MAIKAMYDVKDRERLSKIITEVFVEYDIHEDVLYDSTESRDIWNRVFFLFFKRIPTGIDDACWNDFFLADLMKSLDAFSLARAYFDTSATKLHLLQGAHVIYQRMWKEV